MTAAQAQTVALPAEAVAAGLVRELAAEAWPARERIAALEGEFEAAFSRRPSSSEIRLAPVSAIQTVFAVGGAFAVGGDDSVVVGGLGCGGDRPGDGEAFDA